MKAVNNYNIVEIPNNDTNHCKYCRERLGARYIISNSKLYCNIECLRGHLSFQREIIDDKTNRVISTFSVVLVGMSAIIFVMFLNY